MADLHHMTEVIMGHQAGECFHVLILEILDYLFFSGDFILISFGRVSVRSFLSVEMS